MTGYASQSEIGVATIEIWRAYLFSSIRFLTATCSITVLALVLAEDLVPLIGKFNSLLRGSKVQGVRQIARIFPCRICLYSGRWMLVIGTVSMTHSRTSLTVFHNQSRCRRNFFKETGARRRQHVRELLGIVDDSFSIYKCNKIVHKDMTLMRGSLTVGTDLTISWACQKRKLWLRFLGPETS